MMEKQLEKITSHLNKKLQRKIKLLLIEKVKSNFSDDSPFLQDKIENKIYKFYKQGKFKFDINFNHLISTLESQMITTKELQKILEFKDENVNEFKDEDVNEDKVEFKDVVSITFGKIAEHHVGMKQIKSKNKNNIKYTLDDFKRIKKKYEDIGCKVEIICLNDSINVRAVKAYVMVVRNAVNNIMQKDNILIKYHKELTENVIWDTQYYDIRRKRKLNKLKRANMCVDEVGEVADIDNKIGTTHPWSKFPILSKIKAFIEESGGEKFKGLKGEGNRYLDGGVKKHGIGYHGDVERPEGVVCVRSGKNPSMDMHFQWYQNSERIGEHVIIKLNAGDIYYMCAKAGGADWRRRKVPTLRHATGAPKIVK